MKIPQSLPFEAPIVEMETKLAELDRLASPEMEKEIQQLRLKIHRQLESLYGKLSPWQKVQVARHPDRPHSQAYIERLFTDWQSLSGDRLFSDDLAIISGVGRFEGRTVVAFGQERGTDIPTRLRHNFGMARPEGYRKAQRLMRFAERFSLPVISFIDTPGAYPGVDAESRGQASAIARAVETALGLRVPSIAVVIGEGGSGGALAFACANTVLMLEHAVYSVISPEGCASILWRSADEAERAATALRLTSSDLLRLEVIDRIVTEPVGGAHRAREETIDSVGEALSNALASLDGLDGEQLRAERAERFLAIGRVAA